MRKFRGNTAATEWFIHFPMGRETILPGRARIAVLAATLFRTCVAASDSGSSSSGSRVRLEAGCELTEGWHSGCELEAGLELTEAAD